MSSLRETAAPLLVSSVGGTALEAQRRWQVFGVFPDDDDDYDDDNDDDDDYDDLK